MAWLFRLSLTVWILIATVVGIAIGWAAPEFAVSTAPLADLFLRLIKLLVVPLIFGTLVVGIAGHGDDLSAVGRIALKVAVYFTATTILALTIALIVVNTARPGDGVALPKNDDQATAAKLAEIEAAEAKAGLKDQSMLADLIRKAVPESFFNAAATNQVLQVVVFAVLFASGLTMVTTERRQPMLSFCDALAETMLNVTKIVMYYAPIGIGAAIGVAVGSSGLGVLWTLAYMVGTLYVALLLFVGLVLVPVLLVWRIPLGPFAREIRTPFLIAFTTASSEAALPLAMERLERLGVPKRIVAFVMPTGYSFNLDGSTLYLAIASIFAAQAGGIELSLPQQLLIMGTLLLTSKGVAAVPRASLVILTATLTSFKLPLEAIVLIMGVDAFMDMARTSVNLTGNCVASCVIARWEGDVEPGSALDLTAAAAPPPPAPASPPAQAG